ncbi:MAG: ribonuclease III [Myxococcota bacterium]
MDRTEELEEQLQSAVADGLGHPFADESLLRDALTHRSFRNERPGVAPRDNERLEFLGDSVLGARVAMMLFEAFPTAREGELTRKRADLVCEATLAEIAIDLKVGPALRLGKGEDKSGGRTKPRLLASALEALIGAVHVDGGTDAAFRVVEHLIGPRIGTATSRRDDKSRIQELVQARHRMTPTYRLVRSEGPDHDRRFFVALEINGEVLSEGTGRSKSEAEQNAARAGLQQLEADA